MDQISFSLTKNELQVMELMWLQGKPLSRSEIIRLSKERSWKDSSIHILLNSLLKKRAIRVDGFVKTGRNYGRTFSPMITHEEYQVMQFKQSANYLKSKSLAITSLVSTLIEDSDIDNETLERLEAILHARKGEKK